MQNTESENDRDSYKFRPGQKSDRIVSRILLLYRYALL